MENEDKMWYDKYWKVKETPEFIAWFKKGYGDAKDFSSDPIEQNEYWVRRAFALMGWLGR